MTHLYLRAQRSFLEAQYHGLTMKIHWSIAHLNPLLMAKVHSMWDADEALTASIHAGQRILSIVEASGLRSDCYKFYHWEALRTTTKLLQIFLRNDIGRGRASMRDVIESCHQGIGLCRKLVPGILATVEDKIERTLNQ